MEMFGVLRQHEKYLFYQSNDLIVLKREGGSENYILRFVDELVESRWAVANSFFVQEKVSFQDWAAAAAAQRKERVSSVSHQNKI